MSVFPGSVDNPAAGSCPFCDLAFVGAPNQCRRCGTLLGEAAEDVKRLGKTARHSIRANKALADVLFLVGLFLGGPMMTLGGEVQLGLFILLAGGLASVLLRYTDWSALGTVLMGSLGAGVVAALLIEPAETPAEDASASEAARVAFVDALATQNREILVESRGPGSVTVWFTVPDAISGECGEYPERELRSHLAELGFLRIVVRDRNQMGGLCSFRP